ncbi:unnamed protein product [Vitrella brassicaformis CCMP3155]|uniref:Uncharacterized protein n=1 Tax=Vitrella brassicaformis (strain CCMP3155) TaxID=1169540 RepID=A0A0G4EPE1_VITBC|nr:unnamed protein product [Vitrella brassicaformis CCMP3155]|eukprot:CEL99687.1 unnamed protein product [Vitrella brassicaformis CCMP3155]
MAQECVTDSDCPSGEVCYTDDSDDRWCKTEDDWNTAGLLLLLVLAYLAHYCARQECKPCQCTCRLSQPQCPPFLRSTPHPACSSLSTRLPAWDVSCAVLCCAGCASLFFH